MNENYKNWILLQEDLRTPYMIDVGGQSRYESNMVGYCIVKAKNRKEAIKYIYWLFGSMPDKRPKTIVEPMVVEVKELKFNPPEIIYK